MRAVFVHGEVSAEELQSVIAAAGASVQSAATYAFGDVRIALFVGQKFFFRTNDHLGLVILGTSNGTTQRIDISVAGKGAGAFGGMLGAGDSFETDAYNALAQILASRSLQFQSVDSPATD